MEKRFDGRCFFLRLCPFVVAALLFFTVSALYFAPQFAGQELPQHDVVQYEGMAHDIRACRAETGEDPQWTGGMFGGMPAYLINVAYPAQVVKNSVGQLVRILDTPAAFLLFAMLAMWLMLRMAKVNPWAAIPPALAYGLSTYFLLIIGAGHITKMWALVYAPLMMGGAWMTLRGNRWVGAALTALFTSLEVGANHPQITYYFLVTMALFWLSEGVIALRESRTGDFLRRTALLAVAGVVAVGSNFSPLWYTLQHTPDTIRGGSELVAEQSKTATDGLDLAYATAWSYGPAESWNLLIPDFMGGDSMRSFARGGEVAEALQPYGLSSLAGQLPAYWGDQPFTAGPTYLGAVVILLALVGLLLSRGRDRWWVVIASLLALLLAWGSHFMALTELMFRWLPGYNKFRTVSMFLVVIQWTVPLMAAVALMKLRQGDDKEPHEGRLSPMRALAWATGIVGGLCLLFAVAGSSLFDFGYAKAEQELTTEFGAWFRQAGMETELNQGLDIELGRTAALAMAEERASIMARDAWRSLVLVLLTAAALWLYLKRGMKWGVMLTAITLLVVVDLVPVDMRYLNHDNFQTAHRNRVTPTAADQQIMADKELGYRVLNLTVSPFNDATTSYFHRSVGGYHGAKLARYQDLIDRYLTKFDDGVLDMLNTRYVILSPDSVLQRPTAAGAAWFVNYTLTASSAEEELTRLGEVDPTRVAIIRQEDIEKADRLKWEPAGEGEGFTGSIRLTEYQPNYLKYEYEASEAAIALFSEIYYDKGWSATIDGQEVPYFRANYVLRGMQLPAGEHIVEWRFRAPAWRSVEAVTLICSLLILGGCALLAFIRIRQELKNRKTEETQTIEE